MLLYVNFMRLKEIVVLGFFIIFVLPLLVKVLIFSSHAGSPEATEEGAELLVEAATPWWVPIIDKLSDFGTFGALLILGVLAFAGWINKQ